MEAIGEELHVSRSSTINNHCHSAGDRGAVELKDYLSWCFSDFFKAFSETSYGSDLFAARGSQGIGCKMAAMRSNNED